MWLRQILLTRALYMLYKTVLGKENSGDSWLLPKRPGVGSERWASCSWRYQEKSRLIRRTWEESSTRELYNHPKLWQPKGAESYTTQGPHSLQHLPSPCGECRDPVLGAAGAVPAACPCSTPVPRPRCLSPVPRPAGQAGASPPRADRGRLGQGAEGRGITPGSLASRSPRGSERRPGPLCPAPVLSAEGPARSAPSGRGGERCSPAASPPPPLRRAEPSEPLFLANPPRVATGGDRSAQPRASCRRRPARPPRTAQARPAGAMAT